jgi:hypothetical protein
MTAVVEEIEGAVYRVCHFSLRCEVVECILQIEMFCVMLLTSGLTMMCEYNAD